MAEQPSGTHAAETLSTTAYDELVAADRGHLLHPMSVPGGFEPLILERAEGCWVTDASGETFLDANCGLMNVNVGYGRRELAETAAASMAKLGYAKLFWGHSSVASVKLAMRLSAITPRRISRFFFTSSGSEATDSAIKLIRYRNIVTGSPDKLTIIGREHSYHGMSFGAWSATGETAYWRNFGPRAPRFAHIAQPAQDDFDAAAAVEEAIVREGPDTVAAFIAEPVSLPSRITIPPSNYWPRVRKICDKYDVLLVFDEVVTGFGRTGKWFAGEHWNVEPDLIILSKGITSGYLPLGALGMSEEFAASIPSTREPILHGFTTGGHPVACDVALRNIEIIEQERLVENAEHIGTYLRDQLDALGRRSNSLANVRGLGVLAGADLMADRAAAEPFSADVRIGEWIIDRLRQERTIMRAYGETLAIGLPLSATQADVDELLRRLSTALDAVPTDLRKPALVSP